MAEAAELDYKHYQKLEGNQWPGVRIDTIDRLAKALGVDSWQLLKPRLDESKSQQKP